MKKDISRLGLSMTTLFERILSGDIPSHMVAKGDGWYAFLDIFPRRSGHTLVIPNRPAQRLSELDANELRQLMLGVKEVQHRLSQHFDTVDFTVCIHDGPLAGQEVPHVHVHLIPLQSMKDATFQKKVSLTPEELKATAAKIRDHF